MSFDAYHTASIEALVRKYDDDETRNALIFKIEMHFFNQSAWLLVVSTI